MHDLMICGLSLIWYGKVKEIKMFHNAARKETNYMQILRTKVCEKTAFVRLRVRWKWNDKKKSVPKKIFLIVGWSVNEELFLKRD
jgi:hypothetical protein